MEINYPINLNLTNKKIVIIGGGKIAERKTKNLIPTGAHITIVSPELTSKLAQMAEENLLTWKNKTFAPDDIKTAIIVIAATNHPQTNLLVKKSAGKNQLVSLVDNPEQSDFQTPTVMRRGKLAIAVSTSGASPLLAKKIHNQLEATFDETYEEYLEFLFNCRKTILEKVEDNATKQQLLKEIVNSSYFESKNRQQEFQLLLEKVLSKS